MKVCPVENVLMWEYAEVRMAVSIVGRNVHITS
jgi:hypothetical protein